MKLFEEPVVNKVERGNTRYNEQIKWLKAVKILRHDIKACFCNIH